MGISNPTIIQGTAGQVLANGTSGTLNAGKVTLSLDNVNSNVGTFNTVTVNSQGQITAAANTAYLTTITVNGDATGSGTSNIALTLATVNSNVGTFAVSTINGKGLVTAAQNLVATGDSTGTSSGNSIALTLATVNSNVGAFGNARSIGTFTVNAKGLVTAAANIVVAAATVTGDVTGSVQAGVSGALTLATVNTNVGTWGDGTRVPKIIVNGKGLITAVSNVAISAATVTGDVTGSVTPGASGALTLATVNASVGTFNTLTVNGKGLVTAAANIAYLTTNQTITATGDATGSGTTSLPLTLATVNSNIGTFSVVTVNAKGLVTAADNLVASGDATGTASGNSIALTLATVNTNTGTWADSSHVPQFVVNGKGLITAVSNVAIAAGTVTGDVTGSVQAGQSGTLTLATVNSNVGTFNTLTVNGKGLVTSAANIAYLTNNQTITLSGDATGSGTTAISVSLASVNASVGTFGDSTHVGQFTVGAKGLITAASNVALASATLNGDANATVTLGSTTSITLGTVNSNTGTWADSTHVPQFVVNGKGLVTAVSNVAIATATVTGDVTGSVQAGASGALTLATVNSNVGTWNSVTVNGKGLVTAGSNVAYLTTNQTITASGDATGSGTTSLALTLANTAITSGTYGDSTHVSQITFDSKGRATSASNVTIASATATGDVTGTMTPGASGALTLATVNGNVGTFGNATYIPVVTVNAKGLVTSISNIALSSSGGGVSSLTGTANQISANVSTGAVGLSIPSTFVAPGSIAYTTNLIDTTNNAVSAAGTVQANATLLSSRFNNVTTVATGSGVILGNAVGASTYIMNSGANDLLIYPAVGAQLDALAANVAVSLPVGGEITYTQLSSTVYSSTHDYDTAGTGITITNNGGGIRTISANVSAGSGTVLQQLTGAVPILTGTTTYVNANVAGVVIASVGTISGVVISGTGGTFTCTAFTPGFYVGQAITISGTFGGTGSITGYANPTTYYVIATTANTNFTLSASFGGPAITTTAGTPTGLTYTPANTGYFTCTAFTAGFSVGQPIYISGTFGGTGSIVGYTNPKVYYVIASTATTNFTLSATIGGPAITTTNGTPTGLTYNPAPAIANGTQILSQVVTPKSSTSKMIITIDVNMTCSTNNVAGYVFLYRNNTCISTTAAPLGNGANSMGGVSLTTVDQPGVTTPVTYSWRVAVSAAGTWYVSEGANLTFGATTITDWIIEEQA